MLKICTGPCGLKLEENINNFSWRNDTKKFTNLCKSCRNKQNVLWYENAKEHKLKWDKIYYESNKNLISVRRKASRIKRGISTGTGITIPEKKIIDFLNIYNIIFETEKSFENCRNLNREKLSFDFFIPNLNFIIEYDGEHHFKPIWGMIKFESCKISDFLKNCYCEKNNINLLRINCNQFNKIEQILKEIING